MRDVLHETARRTGINAIGCVPWGTHLCLFYQTKRELLDILVPYFKAGLENNEFCRWITSGTLRKEEAEEAMTKAMPKFTQYLERRQIEIIPYVEWYLKDGTFHPEGVINAGIDKHDKALANGYDGMRVAGDTTWVKKEDRQDFFHYEGRINKVIGKHRILIMRTYLLGECGADEVIDVVRNHQFVLAKRASKWVLLKTGETRGALREVEKRYRLLVNNSSSVISYFDTEGRYVFLNREGLKNLGKEARDVIGKSIYDFFPRQVADFHMQRSAQIIKQGKGGRFEDSFDFPDGKHWFSAYIQPMKNVKGNIVGVQVIADDITKLKQAGMSRREILSTTSRSLTPLQERFIYSGFKGFNDQEILELLLCLFLTRRECERLAKEFIDSFGSLRGILAASLEELEQAGISHRVIFLIKILHELPEEVLKENIINRPAAKSSKEIFNYLYYSMRDLKKEVFRVIYLNCKNQIIDTEELFEGTIESSPVHPREIIQAAIKHNAVRLVFVHNHPSGDITPSKSDKQLTRDLVFIGNVTQIKVLDHIIIGENRYFSFADAGLVKKYEDDFLNIRIRRMLKVEQYQYLS
jgi:DNA repair protein RadC